MFENLLVVSILSLSALAASADGVKATVMFEGVKGSEIFYLTQKSESQFSLEIGSAAPVTLTVEKTSDSRPVDGSLTVSLSDGYSLVTGGGEFGPVRYYLHDSKGDTDMELKPFFTLRALKSGPCAANAVYDAKTETCTFPGSLVTVPPKYRRN